MMVKGKVDMNKEREIIVQEKITMKIGNKDKISHKRSQ